jgi:hypothetical protein
MVYPALLPLMTTTRLPVVDWTDTLRRIKWTRPFRRKTKSGFCECAITFQTQLKRTHESRPQIPTKRSTVHIFFTTKPMITHNYLDLCSFLCVKYIKTQLYKEWKITSFKEHCNCYRLIVLIGRSYFYLHTQRFLNGKTGSGCLLTLSEPV